MSKDEKFLKKKSEIEILSQPLTTEDGFINEACMNEMVAVFKNMPPTYERLANDPEWYIKKDMWIFPQDIIASFAKSACRLSPYGCPDNLNEICGYLNATIHRYFSWDKHHMIEASLCEINKALYDILYEQGISQFDAWNEPKREPSQEERILNYDDRDPNTNFMDLDALFRNVCLDIRMERRANRVFDRNFQADWEATWPIDYQI